MGAKINNVSTQNPPRLVDCRHWSGADKLGCYSVVWGFDGVADATMNFTMNCTCLATLDPSNTQIVTVFVTVAASPQFKMNETLKEQYVKLLFN